jgi:hypothetical protein
MHQASMKMGCYLSVMALLLAHAQKLQNKLKATKK